jgi:hypothetical protein
MAKWYSDSKSVMQGIETVATNFCEKHHFYSARENASQKDEIIKGAKYYGEEEYDETKSAEKAFKFAMLYIAYIIAESVLVDHNAVAPPDERVVGDAPLDAIINGACDECGVKLNVGKLQESLLRIVKFVSEKSIEIYNAGKETRRLAAEKERAEAEKERAEAQKEKFRTNALLIQQNSFEENAERLGGLHNVLPSRQTKSRTHINTLDPHIKIRAVLFLCMFLEILEARKSTITKVDDFEKFFKQLFVAWLKGKNVTGYEEFTIWMAKKHPKINLPQLELLEVYDYLKKWDIEVNLEVVKLKNSRWSTNATPAYTCPAWLLVNHITFEQVISVLATPNIFNDTHTPLLSLDGNTIFWSEENFNSFDKFYFQYDKKPTSNSDDDD